VIGAGGTGLLLLFRSADGPADAVRGYLSDVQDARYADAYARLCASVQGRGSAAQYAVVMRAVDGVQGVIVSFDVQGVRLHRETGVPTAREVDVVVQRGSASPDRVTYQVGKDNGDYCVLTPDALFSGDFPNDPDRQPSDPFGELPGGGGRGGSGGGSGSEDDAPVRTA
jgi:hypothetical protein